ncbi:MAG: deoxyribonuclease IV [Gemmatimonadetes bacterium]|nr:deoxyribonuclease IV [Gemmatimonadota bacterium]
MSAKKGKKEEKAKSRPIAALRTTGTRNAKPEAKSKPKPKGTPKPTPKPRTKPKPKPRTKTRPKAKARTLAPPKATGGGKPSRPKVTAPIPPPEPFEPFPLIGAHVSSAGGSWETPERAWQITASCFQLFTKTANQWKERAVTADEAARFAAALAAHPAQAVVSHDSYLINLASPVPALRRQSTESFVCELQRAHALGLTGVVSHPGNYIDDRASGLARNAEAIAEALERSPGPAKLFLETTAGSGTALGATFEELAWIIAQLPRAQQPRVGVCVDTCHAHSSGYDLVNDYDGVWARFGDVIGWERLGALHLNDSKTPFNSRRDRHELLAGGSLGAGPFRRIMTDERLARVPKLLETPKGDDMVTNDRRMLQLLRSYATGR